MMSIPSWNEVAISKSHDRKGFDCGQNDLNTFLKEQARKAHEVGVSKTYVALDASDSKTIHGFYTLSPAQVDLHRVPVAAHPSAGKYAIGGFRLGRLAVSLPLQGHGLGGQLLMNAARRCIRVSSEMGGTALLIDAKDEKAAAWYRLYGAIPLNDMPLSLVLPYIIFKQALEAEGKTLYA